MSQNRYLSPLQSRTSRKRSTLHDAASSLATFNHDYEARDFGRGFTIVLFVVFIAALLVALVVGTQVYSSLANVRTATGDSRMSSSFVVNSIKGHDAIDEIAIGQGPEGVSLILIEALDSGRYETRIYLYKGTIVEEYSLDQAPYDPSRATPLVESDIFDVSYQGGLLTVYTQEGSAEVALHSVRGGA